MKPTKKSGMSRTASLLVGLTPAQHPKTHLKSASRARLRNQEPRIQRGHHIFNMVTCAADTTEINTTFSDGCLGSHIDEERSEMRYVMRIAESSESSKL